ncbi:MAG: DUF2024 family protein [Sphingobacteriales bacterium]|nr:MAG: DUF2024 family protein [Sphingobacteriales bacterium]
MQVAVWDTYVTKKDGSVMHFDIIAPSTIKDEATIFAYGMTSSGKTYTMYGDLYDESLQGIIPRASKHFFVNDYNFYFSGITPPLCL